MDIYEKLYDTICCPDLIECGHKLIDFAEAVMIEKNRASIVKLFYSRLKEHAFVNYVFGDYLNNKKSNYFVCSGSEAIKMYLALAIPGQSSPLKTLKAIKEFGESILSHYVHPIGTKINENQINEIMKYLDKNYNFSIKVFPTRRPVFVLLDYSHVDYNSECLITYSKTEMNQHLLLYHMNSIAMDMPTPEAVFFHELGHALHARYTGNMKVVPSKILDFLKDLCMPNIDTITQIQQCEVFVDVLSMGMMFDSPFAKHDPFPDIHEDDKKIFKKLFEKLIEHMQ